MYKQSAHLWDSIRRLFHWQHGPTEWQRFRAQITPNVPANAPKPTVLINPVRLKGYARAMRTPQVSLPSLSVYLLQHGIALPDPVRHTDAIPPVQYPVTVETMPTERHDDTGAFLLDKRDALFDDVPVSGPLDDDCAPTELHPRTKFRKTMSQLLPPVESEK